MSEAVDISEARKLKFLLGYARRNWYIFPLHGITKQGNCTCNNGPQCGNPGKHPRTPNGFKNATTEPNQIRAWHTRWPDANWALSCGASQIAVVDVDPRNGGDDSLAQLEAEFGKLPTTPRSLTGGGGSHELYNFPLDKRVKTGVLALGVDLKADGGYIVLPPSRHISGRSYEWDAGAHPNETELQDVPPWILHRVGAPSTKQYESDGDVLNGFIGAAFEAAGWLGRPLGGGKQTAQCPWEDEHSCGSRHDTSTVVFAPTKGFRVGWFYCLHAHCASRSLQEVLKTIPKAAYAKAREKLGLDEQYDPAREVELFNTPRGIDTDEEWAATLRRNQEGRITRDSGNAALILANLDEWKGCLQYDSFADRIIWARPAPELPGLTPPKPGEDIADHHVLYVHHWLAKMRGVAFAKQAIQDAIESAAKRNSVHPVREYLDSLQHDNTPRVDAWLHRYLGAEANAYTSAVGRWWLISAVARIYQPGCQADHLVVLEGSQGAGKSTAARILGGDWFLANLPDITNKDASQVLQGHWLGEIGELDAFKGAAGTRVKDWISRTVDSYRPAYGRFTVRRPRSCVFIGTTNEHHYLTDATGARRFWPVRVTGIAREALQHDRDQLWAEAVRMYQAGEPWWPDETLRESLADEQEERFVADDWERSIGEWVDGRDGFTVGEVLAGALSLEPGKWDRNCQTRAGIILRRMGFATRQQREKGGARVRRYYGDGPFRQ